MKNRSIKKVAIANRGEVAVRVILACRELGLRTVLLHSEADVKSRAFRMADESVCIGPPPTSESYLDIERNVKGALGAGADAIHPGFGFLSENAGFAEAVEKAGLVFVGPTPESIRACGDKISAKALIEKAKVPTVPGYAGSEQNTATLIRECTKIGYPVIVKAAAGGGGRGMKVVRNEIEATELIASAQREASSAFGSSVVFLEKYLDRAKHIEIQIFGNGKGDARHLGERECSIQRRHQKIIEEAPSAGLSSQLREQMANAALSLARAVKYRGAGTVEFLLQDNQFFFMEMNTRLQVEHPVTEMVMGVDLVKAQILLAMGEFSLWPQSDIIPRGHSIECRIYAEDCYREGLPSTGKLLQTYWPEGPGRRFEIGFDANDEISSYYDPMIAKVIVWDESRERAINKMIRALSDTIIFGVRTNIPLLKKMLDHAEFRNGKMTTQFVNTYFPAGLDTNLKPSVAHLSLKLKSAFSSGVSQTGLRRNESPWLKQWMNT